MKSIMSANLEATQDSMQDSIHSNLKTRKHHLDDYDAQKTLGEFDNECPIYKIQKIDETDLDFGLLDSSDSQIQLPILYDFDVELFLKTFVEPQSISESDKTLAELNRICDEPIKTTEENKKHIEKELQLIVSELKDIVEISPFSKISKTSEKSGTILTDNLKMLFNLLVFTHYDFVKGDGFNPEKEVILYEQLYKVNVYINKSAAREYTIFLGFPFYVFIRVNIFGKIFVARNDVYKKLEQRAEIEKIHRNSPNTGFNILDIITAEKFIRLVLSKYFSSGFDLLKQLEHTLEQYKKHSHKLKFNKLEINFERFVMLYKHLFTTVIKAPICEFQLLGF